MVYVNARKQHLINEPILVEKAKEFVTALSCEDFQAWLVD